MTPTEFRTALDALHWSQRKLGRILNIAESDARNWASGKAEIPPVVADWLTKRAAHALRTPVPDLRSNVVDAICVKCAEANGAVWPLNKDYTMWAGQCDVCGKRKALCSANDWNWPHGRPKIFVGDRD